METRRAQHRKYHYVYRITCAITGRYYIGMHSTDNLDDGYLGSGNRIRHSIAKYGRECHQLEIIEFLPDRNALKALEKALVTEELLDDDNCMNLRTGGDGGWSHINSIEPEKRPNFLALKQLYANETLKGGTAYWTEESWEKVRQTGWGALVRQGKLDPNQWKKLSPEEQENRRRNLSDRMKAERNPQHGTHIYMDPNYSGKVPNMQVLAKHRFKEGQQPKGWITIAEWKQSQKNTKNSAFGKHWYNDGVNSYLLYSNDERVPSLKKGRLIVV